MNWQWVALRLIRYLIHRDKCRVHDVIRKAELDKFGTELQVAWATEQKIRFFHEQRIMFMLIPNHIEFSRDGIQMTVAGTIHVLHKRRESHQEWYEDILKKNDWKTLGQWYPRGFYYPKTNSLYFYNSDDCSGFLACETTIRGNIGRIMLDVGANEHTFVYGGMTRGDPGTVWPHIKFYGHIGDIR